MKASTGRRKSALSVSLGKVPQPPLIAHHWKQVHLLCQRKRPDSRKFASSHHTCVVSFSFVKLSLTVYIWCTCVDPCSLHVGGFTPPPVPTHPSRLWFGRKTTQQPLMHPCQPESCFMRAVLQGPPSLPPGVPTFIPPPSVLFEASYLPGLLTVGGQASPPFPSPYQRDPRSTRRRIVKPPLVSNLQIRNV